MLEQQGGDALVVHVIGHREADLGLRSPGDDVAGHADHLVAGQREQRHLMGVRAPADPPRLGLGRVPAMLKNRM